MIKPQFCKADSDHWGVCGGGYVGVSLCICVCVCVSENGEEYGLYPHKDYLLWLMAERGEKKQEKDNCSKNKAVRLPSIYVNGMLCAFVCKYRRKKT